MLHPRIEKKLVEEIQANITDELINDPIALYDAIKDMTYAHAVYVVIQLERFFNKRDRILIVLTHPFDLSYLCICRFYEVLRLHPSVPSNLKYALDDDVWPDGGVSSLF